MLDVRPTPEYEAGHIPGAVSIPVSELHRRLRELPKKMEIVKMEIVAYCRGAYFAFAPEAVRYLTRKATRRRC